MMKFSVNYNRGGQATWWLHSANNEMVAWAGESFSSLSNANRAASSFKAGAQSARYEVYVDQGGHYRWRAWRGSDKVASSGESFADKGSAQRAADNVRSSAPWAVGP